MLMFTKVLVANRGAIACRIIRTLRRMAIPSVAVYSDADRHSTHVGQADEAIRLGAASPAQSYLSIDAILDAAAQTGAQAIHPGYGFLSESAVFAERVEAAGLAFIGPTPDQMRAFGLKHTARTLAKAHNVPLLPGTELLIDMADALRQAHIIGYPVMLKSTAGGGGIGIRSCVSDADLSDAFPAVERLSRANFADGGVYLEKRIVEARHVEVQIFGDGRGHVIALGERDCSLQRRNQKVIEETPAPHLSEPVRQALQAAAIRLAQAVQYRNAGTVEFIYDAAAESFYFLEVNTRLQVEHGVTEEVTGIDLVEWMIRLAAGDAFEMIAPTPQGHSIQVRLYAEDPGHNFQPSAGLVTHATWPEQARVETWVNEGTEVTPYYDPLLAKIIVHAEDRGKAVDAIQHALHTTAIAGIETNLDYLRQIAASDDFAQGRVSTGLLAHFPYRRDAIDVIMPGTQTTVQDYPGRLGYWHVGVPPSGPMDSLAFRLANRVVGNDEGAPGLEIAVMGPSLKFTGDAVIAIGGADYDPKLNGVHVQRWRALKVAAGDLLEFKTAHNTGARAYLAIGGGGLRVPQYLGSASTFILGKFASRGLRAGDVLHLANTHEIKTVDLPHGLIPKYRHTWEIGVMYGPHGAPDFFTSEDIQTLFSTPWKVHHNSDRTGVRLIGPKPQWARSDGGEAGLHPSNIHDNAYAIGAIDFTGDMPVILGPDGPSLGGFVCPAVIIAAELWKIGQLRPGDEIWFKPVTFAKAQALEAKLTQAIAGARDTLPSLPGAGHEEPVVYDAPGVVCRASGDHYLLIEFGAPVLALGLRFRVHALERELRKLALKGIIDVTPGVRSLQIHYREPLTRDHLLAAISEIERTLEGNETLSAPSRTIHLPLSWDDPSTQLAIRKYTQSVRPDAPWCPSNIEFIRRINGLASIDDVQRIVFNANYLVLGLGDVYLGAPVATPIDPRQRLVTTKYNPARTWTPENAVGIGGAYLCVYGMEGPGGYQFVGRTLQMWNTYHKTREFEQPWLLRFFDQIKFYPVSAAELLEIREEFPHGHYPLKTEDGEFRLTGHRHFLETIAKEAGVFRRQQQQAFHEERERWAAAGHSLAPQTFDAAAAPDEDVALPSGAFPVNAPVTASVWNIAVEPGQHVEAGQSLIVLEAMKMEILVAAPHAGIVDTLVCSTGAMVHAGQRLITLKQVGAA